MRWPIILCLCLASAFSGWTINGWRLSADLSALREAQSALLAEAEAAEADAERSQRAMEYKLAKAMQEIQHATSIERASAESDRRAADAAHQRLLISAHHSIQPSAASKDPGPPTGCQAAERRCPVLADVLGEVDATAGELAAALDASRISGSACESAFDQLTGER